MNAALNARKQSATQTTSQQQQQQEQLPENGSHIQMNWIESVSNERVKYNVSAIPLSPFSVWYQQQYTQRQQQQKQKSTVADTLTIEKRQKLP